MGWSGGSELLAGIATVLMDEVEDDDTRSNIYEQFVEMFSDHDCDTIGECEGIDPILDAVMLDLGYIEEDSEDEEEDELEDDE
jgi:hypothetical protein